jgi:hypothetical protein
MMSWLLVLTSTRAAPVPLLPVIQHCHVSMGLGFKSGLAYIFDCCLVLRVVRVGYGAVRVERALLVEWREAGVVHGLVASVPCEVVGYHIHHQVHAFRVHGIRERLEVARRSECQV